MQLTRITIVLLTILPCIVLGFHNDVSFLKRLATPTCEGFHLNSLFRAYCLYVLDDETEVIACPNIIGGSQCEYDNCVTYNAGYHDLPPNETGKFFNYVVALNGQGIEILVGGSEVQCQMMQRMIGMALEKEVEAMNGTMRGLERAVEVLQRKVNGDSSGSLRSNSFSFLTGVVVSMVGFAFWTNAFM